MIQFDLQSAPETTKRRLAFYEVEIIRNYNAINRLEKIKENFKKSGVGFGAVKAQIDSHNFYIQYYNSLKRELLKKILP